MKADLIGYKLNEANDLLNDMINSGSGSIESLYKLKLINLDNYSNYLEHCVKLKMYIYIKNLINGEDK